MISQDVRFALRGPRKNKGMAFVIALSTGLALVAGRLPRSQLGVLDSRAAGGQGGSDRRSQG